METQYKTPETMTKTEIMLKAGLNWTVSTKPIYDNEGRELSQFKAITRDDTKEVFSICKNRYTPFQNEALFNVIEELSGTGLAKYTKAGSYRGGAYVFGLCAVPDSDFEVVPGDVCKTYLRISTSHDGSSSINIWPEVYRKVCANGMHAWRREYSRSLSVRHTEGSIQRISFDAGKLLQREKEFFSKFAEQSRQLAQKEFNSVMLDSFLKELFQVDDKEDVSTRALNQIKEVAYLARHGKGVEYAPDTAWAVYNGVTEYVTHYQGKDQEKRALSALMGSGADLRERAFELLTVR